MAGPRRMKNLWSQSASPTPADLLWAAAESCRALGHSACFRWWPDELNWVLIPSLSPVYSLSGLCQTAQQRHHQSQNFTAANAIHLHPSASSCLTASVP